MDHNQSDRIFAFDSLFTTNHIQMMKLLVGYMPHAAQGKLAVYIKFMELQHTMKIVSNHPALSISPCPSSDNAGALTSLLDEILPFCCPDEKKTLQNMKNMFQTFENMQEMMAVIDVLKEMAPEMFSGDGNGGFDFSQMMNMTQGADMSQMTDMLGMMQDMFSSPHQSD